MSGSPACPSTSISATVHCLSFGSLTTSRSRYCQSSMLHSGISGKQLSNGLGHLRSGERFGDQQDSASVAGTKARVGHLRCVGDDDDGKLSVVRVVTHVVEERLAHVEGGTVEHECIGAVLLNQFVDGVGKSGCEDLVAEVTQCKRQELGNLRRVVDEQDAGQPYLLLGSGARQTRLLAFAGLQVHDPHPSAGRVVGAAVVLNHRAPSLQRAHGEGVSLEVVTSVFQHFIGVPVVSEDGVSRVHTQDGVVAVEHRFRPHVACRAVFLAFADNIAFLCFGSGRRIGSFSIHTVCATISAASADAILTRFFASVAWSKASGSSTPIIRHCSLANLCNVAMCSAWRWPNRPCNFKYSDTGRMFCGRKL